MSFSYNVSQCYKLLISVSMVLAKPSYCLVLMNLD